MTKTPSVVSSKTVATGDLPVTDNGDDFELNTDSIRPDQLPVPQIDQFELGEVLGYGGMGLVYRGCEPELGRNVAVKVLLPQHASDRSMQQRFVREARITSRLQHPGIVPVYSIGSTRCGRPFFSMKIVEGDTLETLVNRTDGSPVEQSKLLRAFSTVCEAIGYAHRNGILHLDLKPGNIMVGEFGEVHVMDWGLSCQVESEFCRPRSYVSTKMDSRANAFDETQDRPGLFGTLAYLAPEQARGEVLDRRTDVYGLGAVLFYLLTGQPPRSGDRVSELFKDAARPNIKRLHEQLHGCQSSRFLVNLAKLCLSTNPEHRPSDAIKVSQEISRHIESSMESAEKDLCHFFEVSLDMYCIASLDGFFQRINHNFSRSLGYSESELVTRPFIDFVHPEDVEATFAAVATLAQGKSLANFRNRYRHQDGHYVQLEWTAKSVPEESAIFAVARLVTPE